MRLRKEISESYGVLHAVHECCMALGISSKANNPTKDGVDLGKNRCLIDLCSGKAITAALCGALDEDESNNYFLAIDKMLPHTMPHFLNTNKIQYLCRDIMAKEMFAEMKDIVEYQTLQGRTCILVGMHLCGLLSERAIDFFDQIIGLRGLVLSPCCLPKKHEQRKISFTKGKPVDGEEKAELYNYFRWSNYLKERASAVGGASNVRLYADNEMHTEKNAIILSTRVDGEVVGNGWQRGNN